MGVGGQGMAALRGSYGGLLMFGMLGRMAGLAMANPATIIIGLFMGRSALQGEKERQLSMRRNQARQAHRKYTDEVGFVVGKDSRDTLRRVQRACATSSPPGPRSCTGRPPRRWPPPSRR